MITITQESVSPQFLLDTLNTDFSGSVVMHLGIVRPDSKGRKVVSIEYEADINAAKGELSQIVNEILSKWKIQDIALCRRIGRLDLGDLILMVAVASPHRKEAFKACEYAVECMRNMKSVKKKEILK
ncbi:MAG: molybdenum cofactor biosynthesis protein MoaE [Thermodesulfobacteriota bacterium]